MFSCGVVSTAFYLLIGRLWWRKKFFWKSYYTFFSIFVFSDIEREHLTFFVENFSFDLSKLQPLLPRTCRWKPPFFEKYFFSFFLFYQRKIEQNLISFPRKSRPGCQNCILCTKRIVFWRKIFFWKKTFFLSIWDMGQKNYGLLSVFFDAVVPKLRSACPYLHFFLLFW